MYMTCVSLLWIPFALTLTLPSIRSSSGPPITLLTTSSISTAPASLTLDLLALTENFSYGLDLPTCNGSLLGFDMNRYSCLQAMNTIPLTVLPVTFGTRGKGSFDVQLPRRFSSRKCVEFSYCSISRPPCAVIS